MNQSATATTPATLAVSDSNFEQQVLSRLGALLIEMLEWKKKVTESKAVTNETTENIEAAKNAGREYFEAKSNFQMEQEAKAKFDAGTVSKPSKDLASAMGADQASDQPKTPPPTKKKDGDDAPQESTTARLLKSKRRARDETDGGKEG